MDSRTRLRVLIISKWSSYIALIFLSYVLSGTPGLFEIAGVKPLLLIPCAIMIAVYEGELAGALLGVLSGLLMDTGAGRASGFFALFLLIICTVVGLLFIYYVRLSTLTSTLAVFSAVVLLGALDYFFYFVLWGFEEGGVIFLGSVLPGILYTAAVSPLYGRMVRKMSAYFTEKMENA